MPIKISTLLRCIIVMLSTAILLSFFLLRDELTYIDGFGILLIQMICLVLFLALGKFSTKYPPVIIVAVNLILFVVLRLLVLIFYPESFFGGVSVSETMTGEIINGLLFYMLLGTIACIFGIWIGLRGNARENDNRKERKEPDFTRLLVRVFFFVAIFRLANYYVSGYVGSPGSGAHLNFFNRYIMRLLDPQALLIMILASYYAHKNERKNNSVVLISSIVGYFLLFSLTGSRGVSLDIIMVLLYSGIFIYGNFVLNIRLRHLFLLLIAPLVIAVFFLIGEIRVVQFSASNISFYDIINIVSQIDFSRFDIRMVATNIAYRVTFFEPLFFPMYGTDVGFYDISAIVNYKTAFLSSLNRIIPGKIFGDILFLEYAFPYYMSYEPTSIITESGRVDNIGYLWTMFGMSYQLFGYAGGILFIFLFTAAIAFLIKLSKRIRSFEGYSYGILSLNVLDMWVKNYGIDNLIDRFFHLAVILLIYNTALKFIAGKGRMLHEKPGKNLVISGLCS